MLQRAHLRSKVTSDLPMVVHHMKEDLKCAIMVNGELFVMTAGVEMMLEWLVDSWDSLHGVRLHHAALYHSHCLGCI